MMKWADMHCDTVSRLFQLEKEGRPEEFRENSGHLDLEKMRRGGYLFQNFALFVDIRESEDPLKKGMELLDLFYRELDKNRDRIGLARNVQDVENNRQAGKLSAFLTVEEGGICRGSLGILRDFYRMGVRMMTLTWNSENELGYPHTVPGTEGGLKRKGKEFVKEMERLGMIVDVSHLSDQGFYDVASLIRGPFVASHSNARALCGHSRNLTDDMLRVLGEHGGVAGINFFPDFLSVQKGAGEKHSRICDITAHMRHIADVAGIEAVGLGTDYDGIGGVLEIQDASWMPLLEESMRKQGFTPSEIDKISHENVMRLYREVLK